MNERVIKKAENEENGAHGQNVPRKQNFLIKKINEIILQFSLFFKFWQLLTFQMAILIKKEPSEIFEYLL